MRKIIIGVEVSLDGASKGQMENMIGALRIRTMG
jgi:hypothetical protein